MERKGVDRKARKARGKSSEEVRGCQEREENNHIPKEKTPYQRAYWPSSFLHFLSQLDEPNIFTGTHVMEEYHLGDKPTQGPTLDSVAGYIADLVRKRQGVTWEQVRVALPQLKQELPNIH